MQDRKPDPDALSLEKGRFSQAPGSFSQGIPGTLAESFEHHLTNFPYYTYPVFCPYYPKIQDKAILNDLILLLF